MTTVLFSYFLSFNLSLSLYSAGITRFKSLLSNYSMIFVSELADRLLLGICLSTFLLGPLKVEKCLPSSFTISREASPVRSVSSQLANEMNLRNQAAHTFETAFDYFESVEFLFLIAVGLGAVLIVCKELWNLVLLNRQSYLIRKLGRIELRGTNQNLSPCSYFYFRANVILVPLAMLQNFSRFRMIYKHEAQHLRAGDGHRAFIELIFKSLFWMNPKVKNLFDQLNEFREFSCDETVSCKLDPMRRSNYAETLVEFAEAFSSQAKVSMMVRQFAANLNKPTTLRRRVMRIISESKAESMSKITQISVLGILTFVCFAANAISQAVVASKISMATAEKLVEDFNKNSELKIEMNERILLQMNRLVGSELARNKTRQALDRKAKMQTEIDLALGKTGVPTALAAIPVIESGFENLPESKNRFRSAGIWQFIPETAKKYGLISVTEKTDLRTDPQQSTDAALRYLKANYMRFQDWNLAIMAYNAGEDAIQKGIDQYGTRDPWKLIAKNVEGDKDYLAKVLAAVIVVQHPELLNADE